MKKNLLLGSLLLIVILAFSTAVSADLIFDVPVYDIELSQGPSVTDNSEYWYLNLTVPQLSGMADEEEQTKLNEYFQSVADSVKQEYEEDKSYFEENYEDNDMPRFGYEYSYDMVSDTKDYFVFRTQIFYAAGSSMTVNEYWTLDKHTGKAVELSDLADKERLTEIKGMILDAMKQENEAEEVFWLDEENFDIAFSYIEEFHHWYVNEAGNLVITFDKYEIAPGAYGETQFEISGDKAVLVKDEKYSFDLYVGDTIEDSSVNWYLKVNVPAVGGLADKQTEEAMNAHFAEVAAGIKKEYETAVASAEENTVGEDGPHFGYEYGYEILADTEDFFSFKTVAFFAAGSSMTSSEFWTLDKNTGMPVSWEDVVPADGVQKIHDQILDEMNAANKANSGMYFTDDDTLNIALGNVPAYHHWYLNADGDLVIAFDKYEVAVGAMGTPEFVIK